MTFSVQGPSLCSALLQHSDGQNSSCLINIQIKAGRCQVFMAIFGQGMMALWENVVKPRMTGFAMTGKLVYGILILRCFLTSCLFQVHW